MSEKSFSKVSRRCHLDALTFFPAAFLLFSIEPMAGKHILPQFGGYSSVWAVSLLFFTAMLFLGYLYVYLLTRYAGRAQVKIHAAIVALAALWIMGSLAMWHSMYPPLEWTGGTGDPSLDLLFVLLLALGVPFFLLSTTGPLLSYWWGISASREPYKLYALSNAGSLLALLSYPFLIEPFIRLGEQEN